MTWIPLPEDGGAEPSQAGPRELAVSVGGTETPSVRTQEAGHSHGREELTAGRAPVPCNHGEGESSQGRAARREGGPWGWPSPGCRRHPVSLGSPGLCRRHPKAWCLVGSHLGPQTATHHVGPLVPELPGGRGEGRLPAISSPGACALGVSVLTPLLPSEPSPAVIPAPGPSARHLPFLVLDPSCRLLSHRLPHLIPGPDSACDPKHSLVPTPLCLRHPAPGSRRGPRLSSLD